MKVPPPQQIVSVIVPVYGAAKCLKRCIDSVLSQTYKNLELILVDDGSLDDSGKICDEYAEKDNRVKVIHQANGGPAAACDAGLAVASGDYMAFVDADDYTAPDMYEKLVGEAEERDYDIVWCNHVVLTQETETTSVLAFDSDPRKMLCKLLNDEIKGYLWNKIFKKEFWDACKVQVKKEYYIMEDFYMMIQLLANNPKMSYVNEALYI